MKGIKATHVIIGGCVFPREAKAPYVPSGYSVLGALEYNPTKDLLKCHICGGWFKMLGTHIRQSDGISADAYRRTYGLNMHSSLATPSFNAAKSKVAKRSTHLRKFQFKTGRTVTKAPNVGIRNTAETMNLRQLCQAQIRSRVFALACSLGGTPTAADLAGIQIHPSVFRRALGQTMAQLLVSMGLTPNRAGSSSRGGKGIVREPIPPSLREASA